MGFKGQQKLHEGVRCVTAVSRINSYTRSKRETTMRLAIPPRQPEPLRRAKEFIRRVAVDGRGKRREAQPETLKLATDLPLDLDQRVRLVGEW